MQRETLTDAIAERGFALVPEFASAGEVETLLASLDAAQGSEGARGNAGGVYAMRNVLQIAVVREFAQSQTVRRVLTPVLGTDFVATRGCCVRCCCTLRRPQLRRTTGACCTSSSPRNRCPADCNEIRGAKA